MEEFPKRLEEEVNPEDMELFGRLLSKSRNSLGKSKEEVALQIGTNVSSVRNWEVKYILPGEDKLPAIADAYGIDLGELTRIFAISKKAREMQVATRKPVKKPKKRNFWEY